MEEDSEQNHFSGTAKGIYRTGHDSTRLVKWMAYYEKYYDQITFFDLMTSVLSALNETSEG